MKIAIVGAVHNGGSRFINHALLPALFDYCQSNACGFEVYESREMTVRVRGAHMVNVALFETATEAAEWLVAP